MLNQSAPSAPLRTMSEPLLWSHMVFHGINCFLTHTHTDTHTTKWDEWETSEPAAYFWEKTITHMCHYDEKLYTDNSRQVWPLQFHSPSIAFDIKMSNNIAKVSGSPHSAASVTKGNLTYHKVNPGGYGHRGRHHMIFQLLVGMRIGAGTRSLKTQTYWWVAGKSRHPIHIFQFFLMHTALKTWINE